MCKENVYAKMETLEAQICRCTRWDRKVMPWCSRAIILGPVSLSDNVVCQSGFSAKGLLTSMVWERPSIATPPRFAVEDSPLQVPGNTLGSVPSSIILLALLGSDTCIHTLSSNFSRVLHI